MPSRSGPIHVVTTSRKYKRRTYKTHLLRRSYREDGKVKNETVGNLSHLPDSVIDLIRRSLKGETFSPVNETLEITSSRAHGDVQAVLTAMDRLGFQKLLSSRRCRETDLVTAMVVARIVAPHTKLATTRWWHTRTLAEDLGVSDADENELYEAMDWLLSRQAAIEKKLAHRHLNENGLALYDLSSSYFEGTHCPLAKIGHDRDGKKNKLQVNYGLLTGERGCPVSISVYEGNAGDPTTVMPQVNKIRNDFGIRNVVLVGDRGMISQKRIDELKGEEGLHWITALKSGQIQTLIKRGSLQMGLFDERNLFELLSPDYPGERLMACRNPELMKLRGHKRQSLIEATVKELEKVKGMVSRGKLKGRDVIGVRVGKVINKYKVAKHFSLEIHDNRFDFQIRKEKVDAESALDGLYVIRTSLPQERMSTEDTVRNYKSLSNVERAFRSLKTIDLKIRPIHHRLEDRVRSHIFLCMLAYYVEWHLREVWAPLLFADEDQEAKKTRDPVAPAQRSEGAKAKAETHTLEDGTTVHSFRTLLEDLATIVRNTCQVRDGDGKEPKPSFQVVTTSNQKQKRTLKLLEKIAA